MREWLFVVAIFWLGLRCGHNKGPNELVINESACGHASLLNFATGICDRLPLTEVPCTHELPRPADPSIGLPLCAPGEWIVIEPDLAHVMCACTAEMP